MEGKPLKFSEACVYHGHLIALFKHVSMMKPYWKSYAMMQCLLPGKKDSDWANGGSPTSSSHHNNPLLAEGNKDIHSGFRIAGLFPLTLKFSQDYPSKPPGCYFPAGFFHPNVYDTGRVCLSIINEEKGTWKPSISIKQVLPLP